MKVNACNRPNIRKWKVGVWVLDGEPRPTERKERKFELHA
jgi:hypothetical protein